MNLVAEVLGLLAVAEGAAVVGWLALLAGLRKGRPKRPLEALVAGVFATVIGVGVVRPSPMTADGLEEAIAVGLACGAFGADVVPIVGRGLKAVAAHLAERLLRLVKDRNDDPDE